MGPAIGGGSHIIMAVLSVAAAAAAGRAILKRTSCDPVRVLFSCGCILAAMEAVKQIYVFFNVSGGTYDCWYFPFQLCSVPMYLCLLLPFFSRKGAKSSVSSAFLTFMASYTPVSALAALIYPEDFLRADALLTLHGFVWHGMLLFIAIVSACAVGRELTPKGFGRAVILYCILAAIAVLINMLTEPLMQETRHLYAAMFYLNPYHISPQPVVSTVQQHLGIPAGLILYMAATTAAAGAACLTVSFLTKRSE